MACRHASVQSCCRCPPPPLPTTPLASPAVWKCRSSERINVCAQHQGDTRRKVHKAERKWERWRTLKLRGGWMSSPKTGRSVLRHPNLHGTRSCVQEKVRPSTPVPVFYRLRWNFLQKWSQKGGEFLLKKAAAAIATAETRAGSRVSARTGRFAEEKRTISKFLSVT